MITTEKQHTERSSQLPIEDVFTCHDINTNLAYDKFTGYNFDFPQKWAMVDSSNKVIGLRKLDMIPSSHSFTIGLKVWNKTPQIDKHTEWTDWDEAQTFTTTNKPPLYNEESYTTPPLYIW